MQYHNVYTTVQHINRPPVKSGGLCWLVFARWQDVSVWPEIDPASGKFRTAIQLKDGCTWYYCKAIDKGRVFTEALQKTAAGTYVDMKVTGYLGSNSTQQVFTMDAMSSNQFVVLCKDRDGQIRMMGNGDTGCDFTWDYTSGDNSVSRKRNLSFGWQHPKSAGVYEGKYDPDGNTITPPWIILGDFSDAFSADFNI